MYLDKIIANKRIEICKQKKKISDEEIKSSPFYHRKCYSLHDNLKNSNTGIITEFKRKSPSKGYINANANLSEIVPGYEKAGCCGISILADHDFFAGSPLDTKTARPLVSCPILFKEFIIDEFQIEVAKSVGADVILLIAAVLDSKECMKLAAKAKQLGLETLLEIHSKSETDRINQYIDIVGINNRNLQTFEVDLQASIELCHTIPDQYIKISESGISNPQTIVQLQKEGFKGFLVGENFMKENEPAKAADDFIKQVISLRNAI